jgi:thiazole synthase
VVTVAVRRVNLPRKTKERLLDYFDRGKHFLPPSTAGCYAADEAIRTARLGREVGLSNRVKLEVIGDEKTLFPDDAGLREATRAPRRSRPWPRPSAARWACGIRRTGASGVR